MKRLLVMSVVFVLVSAPLIVGIWLLIEPQYQARGEVRVRPIIPRLVFRTDGNGPVPFYDAFVRTQAAVLLGPTVLQRALDQRVVQETQWYRSPRRCLLERWREKPLTPVERLKAGLSAQPRPGTEIIDVAFASPNAEDARRIVDAVLTEYIKHTRESMNVEEGQIYRQLVDQYKSLENEIQGREKVCAELGKSLGTPDGEELLSHKRMRLDEMQARLSELSDRIAILEWDIQQAASAGAGGVRDQADSQFQKQPKYHEDAEWRQRDIAVRTIRHNIAATELDPNNPDMVRARKDLGFAEELLQLRQSQLDEQWRDRMAPEPAAETQRHELARAKHEEQLLREDVQKQQAEYSRLFETAQLLEKEHNALSRKHELFEAVRARLDQKNIERNVPGAIDVLMNAYASAEPYNDRRLAFSGGALALGLLASAVVRLLMHKAPPHKAG